MNPTLLSVYLSWFGCAALITWALARRYRLRSSVRVSLLGNGGSAEEFRRRKRLISSILAFIGKLTPVRGNARSALKDKLDHVGSRLSVEEFLGVNVLVSLGLCVTFVVIARELGSVSPIMLVVVGVVGWHAPAFWLKQRIARKHRAILRLLPEVIDLLALCIGAGLDFLNALTKVVTVRAYGEEPLIDELSIVLHEMKLGKRRVDALRAMARRVDLSELTSFVRTIVQADRMGTPISAVLAIHSEDLRLQRFMRAERVSLQAPIKLLFPLIFCIMPCVALIVGAPIFLQFWKQNPFAK